ncbi:hypothetical protein [Pseudoalteromonas luteoviolacea]|uniref:Solute-binding protein family 3/N-terminal domain-containing protein n=1 Tax=Pseudoalteromonas luteoviolacea H33 TaxID=1365251 RepID=A0A167EDJ0_9GAMM|nr:hypothetical protein [Pseudoalteromonas luteoviolacea]KZN50433.1 hypothetical protein N476_16445 [Pseudoalteromonas luteoviolacea H33]KZN77918.1 hypothetical protein N477_11020 [Pseudoalteromonas luteoviolacea H33-S]MBQ4879478.1 hypothetical protein [Pseudoalteromonas luteoviolacea]MBQ4908595.1 hypothetical protein [Pseudoalteromonas luteoviolacea]
MYRLIALMLLWVCNQSLAKEFNINISEGLSFHLAKEQIEDIFTRIYGPLDIQPSFHYLPTQRGLQWVDSGRFDAEAGRAANEMSAYTQLIAIPTPLATVRLAVFCLKPELCHISNDSDIITIEGSLITTSFCRRTKLTCHGVKNNVSAFQALTRHHSDQLLATDHFSIGSLCSSGLNKIYMRILPAKGIVIRHYIHKKHQALVPKLDSIIQGMMKSGEFAAFIDRINNGFADCDGEIIKLTNHVPASL